MMRPSGVLTRFIVSSDYQVPNKHTTQKRTPLGVEVVLINCQFASLRCGIRRGAWVASPLQGEGKGEGLPTRQLNQWMCSKTPHLSPLPLLRGEARKRDAEARFLGTDNQRTLPP